MATGYYASQYFTTTLSVVGGINDSQTTGIVIQSTTGIQNTAKPGIALINYADPLNETIAEWVTFSSINSTTKTLQGVTRGAEKGSAKSHSNGVTIAFPMSESHINPLVDAVSIGGDATNIVTGVLDEDTMSSDSAVKVPTQQSVKAYVDTAIGGVGGGALQDTDHSGGSSTSSSTYANITGADVSITLTQTSHILLIGVVQAYANPGAQTGANDYQVQLHDGTSAIGSPMGVSLDPGNVRTTVVVTHIVPSASAGAHTYTLQHRSTDNALSCTAESINMSAVSIPT